jgi:hypothetical protein
MLKKIGKIIYTMIFLILFPGIYSITTENYLMQALFIKFLLSIPLIVGITYLLTGVVPRKHSLLSPSKVAGKWKLGQPQPAFYEDEDTFSRIVGSIILIGIGLYSLSKLF